MIVRVQVAAPSMELADAALRELAAQHGRRLIVRQRPMLGARAGIWVAHCELELVAGLVTNAGGAVRRRHR